MCDSENSQKKHIRFISFHLYNSAPVLLQPVIGLQTKGTCQSFSHKQLSRLIYIFYTWR